MELVTEVREGLRQRMTELDWLDDETRQLSIEKASISASYIITDITISPCSLRQSSLELRILKRHLTIPTWIYFMEK